jgi:anti-sigma factor RsiW
MDHKDAVRLKATEKYLLNELDPDQLDQFEEHLFDCPDCALDVRAAAMFVEQSKNVLSETPGWAPVPVPTPAPARWFAWLRPAFAAPALALLLLVVGYQNLISLPRLKHAAGQPQVLPLASLNVGTYAGEGPVIPVSRGKGFVLFVRIPPDPAYSRYSADLYNPAGKLEWSLTIPAASSRDQWPVEVPAADRAAGTYTLAVHGVTATGESRDVGRTPFQLQIQN